MSRYRSLNNIYGFQTDVFVLWFVAISTLAAGLSLPVITFTELIVKTSTYSIYGGVVDLAQQKEYVLAAVIFVFSIVFPIVKLTSLAYVWFARIQKSDRNLMLSWLEHLGKWSMLDVYVLAMIIVIAKGSALVKAEPRLGIYFFGISVILSIITSMRIAHLSKNAFKPDLDKQINKTT